MNKFYKQTAYMLFLISGLVSLIFQVAWMKMLVLVFGNTIWAVSTLLTAFMAGLALGSWLFGKIADQIKSPLRLYGIIEGIIGLIGIFTPFIFKNLSILYRPLYQLCGGDNLTMGLFKFLLAFIILVIPTSLMGATLPLLAKQFTDNVKLAGTRIGSLYTINTFGAVLGTFLAGFVFIPVLGLKLTVSLAAFMNLIILLLILKLTKGEKNKIDIDKIFKKTKQKLENKYILWIFMGCGFAALSYEILWNRILVLHIGSSVYAYTVMLAVYLFGIAAGSGLMSFFISKVKKPGVLFGIFQLIIAFHILIQIKQFGDLSFTITNLGGVLGAKSYSSFITSLVIATAQILLIPTLLFGASFPLAVKLFIKHKKKVGTETGILYAFNTIGTIFGSFAAGFILVPLLGVQISLFVTGLISLALASILLVKTLKNKLVRVLIPLTALLVFTFSYSLLTVKNEVLLKAGIFQDNPNSTIELLDFSEDIYATVSVEKRVDPRGEWRSISLNGVNVAGTSSELFTIQKLQGHLPLLLHPDPKSVLHIGFGSGGTAHAVSCHPVEKITIAEISKSVIEKSSVHFRDVNHDIVKDPRVNIHYTDGRNFVLANSEKFDVILSDSIHPRFSGNGSLYTKDYYEILKKRLKKGGLVSQWLPFYTVTPENFRMIIKAFYDVFPNTSIWYTNSTLNEYVIVIGKTDTGKIDIKSMFDRFKIGEVKADLGEIQAENPYKILDYFLFGNEEVSNYVGDIIPHTDDNMAVEYESGRVLNRFQTTLENFAGLLKYKTSVIPHIYYDEEIATLKGEIINTLQKYEFATMHNLKGQWLFSLEKKEEAFKEFEMIPFYNPDDLEPVEYFGADFQKPFMKTAKLGS